MKVRELKRLGFEFNGGYLYTLTNSKYDTYVFISNPSRLLLSDMEDERDLEVFVRVNKSAINKEELYAHMSKGNFKLLCHLMML